MNTDSVPLPEIQHARVNGVDLAYLDQGHGVPVVFVHGAPGDHRFWEGQRQAVAERYRFIAPTQRYFGTGPWPDDGAGFSMPTHADDLAAFLRQLSGGPAHVVGHSYGGAIGIVLAVHHPEWVRSLFVFEPGLATFVTDPADAQVAGEDRKDMRAPAAIATEAGDTGAAVRLLMDGVTGQPGTFERLAPSLRSSLLEQRANAFPFIAGRTVASPDYRRPVGPDHGASGHCERRIGAAFLPDCGGDGPSLHSRVATHCHSWRRAPRAGQPRRGIHRSPPELPDDPVTGGSSAASRLPTAR